MAPSRISDLASRLLPFNPWTTPLQATTYLLGISLFSISFLVFLNSAVSFVITDLLGVKKGVGDIVGTLGFADELVALIACPLWGLLSDRLGVRWVAVLGYTVIAVSLWVFVQCRSVYPALILARILFAVGATAAATMVTAILPVLTDDGDGDDDEGKSGRGDIVVGDAFGDADDEQTGEPGSDGVNGPGNGGSKMPHNPRGSIAISLGSDLTITPERFTQSPSGCPGLNPPRRGSSASQAICPSTRGDSSAANKKGRKTSALAGFVGLFTGCGALVALALFLPLPAQFSKKEGVTPAQAITQSFYVVGVVALAVAVFVFFGLRGLRGEEAKGWRMLLGLKNQAPLTASSSAISEDDVSQDNTVAYGNNRRNGKQTCAPMKPLPYRHLLLSSLLLGASDPHIALGYLGGFVARASTVAISLFLPLYVNAYFMSHGFCQGSPNDPSPELKRECRTAYVLAASLSGAAQLIALLCAPVFGYVNARRYRGINWGVLVATSLGIVGYLAFPRLASPEFKDVDGRGGSPVVFLIAALLGISQIGAIVCSLGSLGHGVLGEDVVITGSASLLAPDERGGDSDADFDEREALLGSEDRWAARQEKVSRVQLKGSIAGVYSWCGGAAILLLTKLGGYLFDALSTGAPFYMMAIFNAALLIVSLCIDMRSFVRTRR
ncbi:putative major facilitator superfamily transporter [Rosellinia necatrix]|uniref:Putative major facilitator superfamily transporter n=1 Tax=Rosellinia necatrix TaxID=77044 RepID=A0A1W2THZ4_ROSNE|nr:putative major facilitator superfamily transporter [Rosellinia necatrix]